MKFIHLSTFRGLSLAITLCLCVAPVLAQPPATAKIAFVSTRDGNSEIYIMNPDGREQINLTQHPSNDFDPAWSPTGEQILFVSDRDGVMDLYLMDADGRNVQQIFRTAEGRTQPSWAPDGKKIAYRWINRRNGDVAIYTASVAGKAKERIANGFDPTWSPDGSEIAFISSDSLAPLGGEGQGIAFGELRIQTINLQTHAEENLGPPGFPWMRVPAWAADSTKIAFSGVDGNAIPLAVLLQPDFNMLDKQSIYLMNRDGTGIKQIVEANGSNPFYPSWSPQSDALIYQQRVGKETQLFKVTLANGISEQLTRDDSNSNADWFDPVVALPVSPQPQLLTTQWGQLKKP